jgi:hypothetical protein
VATITLNRPEARKEFRNHHISNAGTGIPNPMVASNAARRVRP